MTACVGPCSGDSTAATHETTSEMDDGNGAASASVLSSGTARLLRGGQPDAKTAKAVFRSYVVGELNVVGLGATSLPPPVADTLSLQLGLQLIYMPRNALTRLDAREVRCERRRSRANRVHGRIQGLCFIRAHHCAVAHLEVRPSSLRTLAACFVSDIVHGVDVEQTYCSPGGGTPFSLQRAHACALNRRHPQPDLSAAE